MTPEEKERLMASERRRRILEIVNEKRSVTVLELAALFPVSPITLRRDLDRLSAERLVERVHGGIMARAAIAVVPHLADKKDLRVITVSPRIVSAFADLVDIRGASLEIITSGGTLNAYKDFLLGPPTRAFFESCRVDIALLSVTAIDLRRASPRTA